MSLEAILQKNGSMYELGMAHIFATRNINELYQNTLKRYGIVPIEWFILGVVHEATKHGGIRVTDLATTFNVKTTYITSILNSLRAKGYVDTRYDANDARVRLAIITDKGGKELPAIERHVRKEVSTMLARAASPDELDKYLLVIRNVARLRQG